MAARKLGADCASSNVVRFRRRRRKPGPPCEAEIIEFPDLIEAKGPRDWPDDDLLWRAWRLYWQVVVIPEKVKSAPPNHPLVEWYLAELRKPYSPKM